jgi:hypothetical protein
MWERLGKGVGMSYAMDFLTYATGKEGQRLRESTPASGCPFGVKHQVAYW